MNLGRLCQIILKPDKEISGYGHFAQEAIFAYYIVRKPPLIALPPLRLDGKDKVSMATLSMTVTELFLFIF